MASLNPPSKNFCLPKSVKHTWNVLVLSLINPILLKNQL
jgi:hypothetical protein